MIGQSMIKQPYVLIFTLICATIPGFAQDTPLVIKKLQAHYKKIEKEVKDITLKQTTTLTTAAGTMDSQSTFYQKGNKIRVEMDMKMPGRGTNTTIMVMDGKDAWTISPLMGKQKITEDLNFDYPMMRKWWDAELKRATVKTPEKIDGQDCYVVEMHYRKNHPYYKKAAEFGTMADTMWLTKKDMILVQQLNIDSKQGKILYKFSNFKGRWNIPYKTTIYQNGQPIGNSIVKSVRTNSGLSDKLFNPDYAQKDDSDIDMDEIRELLKEHKKSGK